MTGTKRSIELGRLFITPGASEGLDPRDTVKAVHRHRAGDWGDCGHDDRLANEDALEVGARLFSVYHDRNGTRFWVITEADRSATTVLLPEEY